MPDLIARLARLELIVVTGKGGTGKTTIAAALGFALRARGRRVLVLEADPRESLHQMYGAAPSGGEVVAVEERLAFQNVSPRRVVDSIVRERLRFGPLLKRTLASPVYQHFVEGAPGLRELALLAHAERAVHGKPPAPAGAADVVVLDAPASGHARTLLAAPALVADAVGGGPFAELARALAVWMGDVDRVGVVLATLAEELPVAETLELQAALLGQRSRGAEAVIANELYPVPPPARRRGDQDPVLGLWRARRAANDRELARLRAQLSGVGAGSGTPVIELPLLPLARGPQLAGALAGVLATAPPQRSPGAPA